MDCLLVTEVIFDLGVIASIFKYEKSRVSNNHDEWETSRISERNFISQLILDLQEEEIYDSIQQLRDQSEDLQTMILEKEKAGDNAAAEKMRKQLTATEACLLEKNQERHAQVRASR